jgi:hypothetical protein
MQVNKYGSFSQWPLCLTRETSVWAITVRKIMMERSPSCRMGGKEGGAHSAWVSYRQAASQTVNPNLQSSGKKMDKSLPEIGGEEAWSGVAWWDGTVKVCGTVGAVGWWLICEVWHSEVLWHSGLTCEVVWHSEMWHGEVWHGEVWHGVTLFHSVWFGIVWWYATVLVVLHMKGVHVRSVRK